MKQFTVKELSKLVSVSEGTIRSWIMKPIDNVPYSAENVNYENLQNKLRKYFTESGFMKQFGFDVCDIEIVKAQRSTKDWMTFEQLKELEVGKVVTLHNYSLKTNLKKVAVIEVAETLIVFEVLGKKDDDVEYKCYGEDQLSKENMKVELADAQ